VKSATDIWAQGAGRRAGSNFGDEVQRKVQSI